MRKHTVIYFPNFLVVLFLFGVNNVLISLFLSFKVMKAKKAAIVGGQVKLIEPKILF